MSAPRIAAVIGSPVAHSLSPAIHQAAFDAAGVNWAYAAFDVTDARAALSAMRLLGIAGLSVTMPLKEDVARAVDRLDPASRALHSVNTVSWDGDELVGSSTDGAGFVASLAAAGVEVDGAQIAVIGAGGAARSVIDALGRAGAADITVLNRTRDRAEQAASLSKAASVGIVSDVTRADIVINATSVGMGVSIVDATDADMACDPALLRSGQIVADLVYHPLETAWMRAASDVGATTVDGLGMLVHQAALQQLRWLGKMPDTTAMRIAAEAELASR
ncbi:MAG: shikimate dehydrogenase [Actinomycetota bacterium]|jgi:shikimate dehydrogenase|uniref:shikimate dehydrogenase n=1 Tax=uncultured Ilumatobacter sp. TaxID=879968 RepID=UPI00374EC418|nr:shikimate dehydrogenase [Actinomycetota bacterium]